MFRVKFYFHYNSRKKGNVDKRFMAVCQKKAVGMYGMATYSLPILGIREVGWSHGVVRIPAALLAIPAKLRALF